MKSVELAEKLGITTQDLSKIEKNQTTISPERAKQVADAIGVRSDSFVRCATKAWLKRQETEVESICNVDLSVEEL
jgi:plasmid maintenance system antidote protein VapI